jgi:Flp pilus assembly protein TadD
MPVRTYMGVDPRHDHSIRVPRPDLSASLGTPNACNDCHQDRSPTWAANAIERAFGPKRKGFQNFGAALHAARVRAPGATAGLLGLLDNSATPAIVRATALTDLRPFLNASVMPALGKALADPDPMLRGAALETLLSAPPAERMRLAMPLLEDPSRMVRIKAARALSIAPAEGLDATTLARLERGFAEYVASQRANSDRPEALVNLGLFYSERRDALQSEREYRAALALAPRLVPALVNLADLYRMYGREKEAEATLLGAMRQLPDDADLAHALGLLRVREGRVPEALPLLAKAAQAAPGNSRYAYVYGVALHDSGQPAQGLATLEKALERFPSDPELLYALASYARDAGDERKAKLYASRLAELAPSGPAVQQR